TWPHLLWPVPVELDPVLVGIAQIERFAHAMIAGAVKLYARAQHAMQRIRQRRPRRIEDGGVIEAGRARRRRMAALALPGVEPDVVVIAASRYERRARTHALHQIEAEHIAIETQRAVKIGHLEMDVPDAGAGDDGWIGGHRQSPWIRGCRVGKGAPAPCPPSR